MRARIRCGNLNVSFMKDPLSRVLALDIHARRLGFVVFEGPECILDLGVRLFASSKDRSHRPAAAARKVAGIVLYFHPDLVLIRRNGKSSRRNLVASRRALSAISAELQALQVPAKLIRESTVRSHFRSLGPITRYHIAEFLATKHPQLAWHLPPPRKPWQSERAILTVFDAAALAAVHFYQSSQEST